MLFFNCRSKTFLESQNPCRVFPKELGPAEVGVSLQNSTHFSSQEQQFKFFSMEMKLLIDLQSQEKKE